MIRPPISKVFFLCFLLALFACQKAPPVVKIGLVAPFEGENRAVGYDVIYSARLAVREVNRSGSIGRYRLALAALDDGGDPELAAEVADSLIIDPGVIAVVGHWLTPTTAVAGPIYQAAETPFLAGGERPFLSVQPDSLPADFLIDYGAVTPFDETAGPYAGPAYDAFYLLIRAMEMVVEAERPITRQTIQDALQNLRYEGITGEVYRP